MGTCRFRLRGRRQARGAIALTVALSLLFLVAVIGLGVDLGRLYVNKTRLQTAADACALAAAAELVCDPASTVSCPASYLQNAEAAGIYVARRNSVDDGQGTGSSYIHIAAGDVRFYTKLGPDAAYLSRAAGASPNSRYAMCIARAAGITPWLMGIVGVGAQSVNAMAVATSAPGQSFCNAAPVGICSSAPGPSFGLSVGQWVSSPFHSTGNNDSLAAGGKLAWVDYTPNAGGNSEIRDQLAGAGTACNLKVGDNVKQPGQQQGAKSAYNTRFGLYPNGANAYTVQTAPPDRTGYAYPNATPGSPVINNIPGSATYNGMTAYADYLARQNANAVFDESQYDTNASDTGGKVCQGNCNAAGSAQLNAYGSERRLVTVPIIDCGAGNTVPIRAVGCALLLNPMANGANGMVYLEYRGLASAPGSACRSAGVPGGNAGTGPDVPTLVQ